MKIEYPDFVTLAVVLGLKSISLKTLVIWKKILQKTISSHELELVEIPITNDVNDNLVQELNDYYS